MVKKVLIIYPYINQMPLVFHMVINLRKNGINVDAINSTNFKFVAQPIIKKTFRLKVISFFYDLPVPKIKGLIFRIINAEKELQKVAEHYDLIDFHVLNKTYDKLILKCQERKKVKVSIWGSDFYRANKARREEQRLVLDKVNCIQISTKAMKTDFLKCFQNLGDKIKIANFGLFQFDLISEILNTFYTPRFKIDKFSDKLMVVCGYNGSRMQQHLIIIEAISKLDQSTKDKIFLVFPMTYGSEKDYIKYIEKELKEINIPFLLLRSHLSNIDLAKLRIESDLVINIQKTDAFSGSLQEHLFAGSLLLVGNWLPYNILDEAKIFYKKTNIPDLSDNIRDCIDNYNIYSENTLDNKKKMHEISSWEVAGKRMSMIYKKLLR